MEQVQGTHKASKFEPQDFISGMADNVITNILDRLPVRDAVKTDILSKFWKFKWILLTHLIFDKDFFYCLRDDKFDGKVVSRLLLHVKGPITKFVLYMPRDDDEFCALDDEDVKHWIIYLSSRGLKEIILDCSDVLYRPYLPTQLYSCMELKHLELCRFNVPSLSAFHGFPNLSSLHLSNVAFVDNTFGEFIARCPLLEILSNFDDDNTCELGLIEISKLGNLKKLSWSVGMGEGSPTDNMIKSSCFYELTALPKLQELNLDFGCCKFMAEAGVDKVPAAFLCLKTLTLSDVDFSCDIMASFVLKLICNSPNLQDLNITGPDYDHGALFSEVCSLNLGCNTMKQLQLRSVSFSIFRGSKNELCLIKFILTSSPLLNKIVIRADEHFLKGRGRSERGDISWRMAGKLLKLHRASPMVDINLC